MIIHTLDCNCNKCKSNKSNAWYAKKTGKKKKKRRKKKKSKKPKYKTYIKSKAWQNKREKFLKSLGGRCERCNSRDSINVHHMHYGFVGREKEKHVALLCKRCHFQFHERYKTKTKMVEETTEFIQEDVIQEDQQFIKNICK